MNFQKMMELEAEGAAAALAGKTSVDCPLTESSERNHWIFGYSRAQNEMETIKRGEVFFSSTSHMNPCVPGTGIPLQEAIERGLWKPKYASITASSS
jgi:ribosome modulation factor